MISTIDPNDLKAYAKNSRKHSPEQIRRIENSIKEFGFLNPILIDKDNTIIAGHARVLAAKNLGLKEIRFLRVEHLTKTQKQAYVIADNRLAELSEWNYEILELELNDLLSDDFNIELTGFDDLSMFEKEVEKEIKEVADEQKNLLLVECSTEIELSALFREMNERGLICKIMN